MGSDFLRIQYTNMRLTKKCNKGFLEVVSLTLNSMFIEKLHYFWSTSEMVPKRHRRETHFLLKMNVRTSTTKEKSTLSHLAPFNC